MRLGIDLGGTNLAYGLVDELGNIIQRGSQPIVRTEPNVIADLMADIYESYSDEYTIDLVGIGVPGIVSNQDGVVITCVNLHWKMVPLATYLKGRIKSRVIIGNDANAACIGEVLFGSMTGCNHAVLLTLGTGVGGGVITNGKLLTGYQGAGAELGHIIIGNEGHSCNCGNVGCLETYISASALIRYYNERNIKSPVSNAKDVFERFKQRDLLAEQTVDWFTDYFAKGIINIYNIFAPEIIAIGGGVSHAFNIFYPILAKKINARLFSQDILYGKIVTASLFNDAGIIGAAFLDKF